MSTKLWYIYRLARQHGISIPVGSYSLDSLRRTFLKCTSMFAVLAILLSLAASQAEQLQLSKSKLGIHILGIPSPSTDTVLQKCPRVIKVFPEEELARDLIYWYRTNCPGGTVVLRVFLPRDLHYGVDTDPDAAADDVWWRFIAGPVMSVDPSWVDWIEGPNELDTTDNWYRDPTAARWFANFWSRLADQINYYGYNPLVGSIAAGNPALGGESGFGPKGAMGELAAVMKSKPYRIGWSYHAYSLVPYDANDETWVTLRYRMIRDQAGLKGYPLVLTEGGLDAPGWRRRNLTNADYMKWLAHLDSLIKNDTEVVGVTLFTIGNQSETFSEWDLNPIAGDLATYLK